MPKPTLIKGRIIKKVAAISLLAIVLILLVLTALFQLNKDKIARSLLLRANTIQDGELVFNNISFNPLIHLPDVTIVLNEIQYYQQKKSLSTIEIDPILSLERLYLDFDLFSLLKGELHASNIHFENGKLDLILGTDGILNLTKALRLSKKVKKVRSTDQKLTKPKPEKISKKSDSLRSEKTKPKIKQSPQKSVKNDSLSFTLDIEKIILNEIEVSYNNQIDNLISNYQIQSIEASLQFTSDTILCALDAKLFVTNANITNRFSLDSKQISLNTKLILDNYLNKIVIEPSKLVFNNANFIAKGTLSLKDQGYIDLEVKGDDSDFGILNLFLTNIGMDNIEKGDMFFDATIKGEMFGAFPRVKGSFGINDLQINIPTTTQKVRELSLRGSFDSGDMDDFSGASLIITDLSAKLPKGNLQGYFQFDNFLEPKVDIDFSIKTDINGFEQLFNLGEIQEISGIMGFKTRLKGNYNLQDKLWNQEEGSSEIMFEDVSFSVSEELNIENINGKISFEEDVLSIDTFKLNIGESELVLNASVSNPKMLIGKVSKSNDLLNGYQGAYFPIDTLTASQIDIDFGVVVLADDFKSVIPINSLDSLSGGFELKSTYRGIIDWESDLFETLTGESNIKFDNLAFMIGGLNEFKNIKGTISLVGNNLYFNNVGINYGKSDVLIKGSLSNLHYMLVGIERTIEGKLQIQSNVFDYPDFFSWDTYIASTFPYRIKDIKLTVQPKTTTKNLVDFIRTPRIEFKIDQLDAEIEDFLPPISINKGYFVLADKDSAVNLDFDDFEIDILKGKVAASVEIQSSRTSPNWLKVQTKFSNVNLKKTFIHWKSDTIPEYFNGLLQGNAHVDMTLLEDGFKFKKIDFISTDLEYKNAVDTIAIAGFQIDALNITYDSASNFLETLSFQSELFTDNIKIKNFNADNLGYQIKAQKGAFTIVPIGSQFLSDNGEGLYVFKPFEVPSYFEIKYKVDQFDIADLLGTFSEKPMINGKMSLDLDLISSGNNREELLSSLNGYISLYGDNLSLTGVDIDKLIERFKRSQRFTFADIGAVMLLGPAGILLTKGTDYTSMAVLNKDEGSEILEFSSDYKFNNGRVTFQDVALSTTSNRLAAKGSLDLKKDTLDMQVAVLNSEGCSIFSQSISGSIAKPVMGKVKAGKIILAPITNLAKKAVDIDCDVFYEGKVKDPEKND